MTKSDFYKKLENEDIFENEIFDLKDQILNISSLSSQYISFDNCTFNCRHLGFKNIHKSELSLEFKNCTFNCTVNFTNSVFKNLLFTNTKFIESLILNSFLESTRVVLNVFEFSNDANTEKPKLKTDFYIRNTEIKDTFSFENVNHIEGKFVFLENKLGNKEKNKGQFMFTNSTFTNAFFGGNYFNELTTFYNTTFKYDQEYLKFTNAGYKHTRFHNNTFEKVNFSNSTFIEKCDFDKCDFLSTTWFEECKSLTNSHLKFIACEFKGFSLFNKCEINLLNIRRCTFDKSSSFADAEFNTLKLFEVKFAGGAYFDEMKINKVLDKSYLKDKSSISEWKKTLRAIKQESQKTENRIDFNNYRNYELAAHYKELSFKKNFKDASILWATKWSSNFGNWFWSLCFTLLSGFIWYSILYRIENGGAYNPDQLENYFISLFRFFLITDFYSPFETGRTYLSNIGSWIPFIFGKIFIAFGIYEMIQSFRKFKA